MKIKPIKVSLLNQYVKKFLKSNSIFYNLYVEGEISNIRISKTGYTYFTLSDGESSISCVCFYADSSINDGNSVVVNGELTVYEVKGTYQLVVKNIEKIGLGNIFLQLEELKNRLKKQGFLENKKDIPILPSKIGVITSKTGAALQDILRTFNTVNGAFEVRIYNSLVQGDSAKGTIIEGLNYFNINEPVEAILLSRGGGSFEDLNVFNDIELAEAIYKSNIPVITGIGHDTDVTLCDYVADVHCHTPTAAAEYLIRGYKNIGIQLGDLHRQLRDKTLYKIKQHEAEVKAYKFVLKNLQPDKYADRLIRECIMYKNLLSMKTMSIIDNRIYDIGLMNEKLKSFNYRALLKNGYAVVLDDEKNLVRDASKLKEHQNLSILFDKYMVDVTVNEIKEV